MRKRTAIGVSVSFVERRGHAYYRARFLTPEGRDLREKIPDSFWLELGHEPPRREAPKFEQLANQWAGKRSREIEEEQTRRAAATPPPRKKFTIAQVFEHYCARNPNLVGADTIDRERCSFAALTKHIPPDTLPEDIDADLVVEYRNLRMNDTVLARRGTIVTDTKRPVRSRTIRNELDLLRRLVAYALTSARITGCEGVQFSKLPEFREDETSQVALREDEFEAVLKHASERHRRILIFGVCSMLRRTPLLALRAEWVDRKRSWLRVPAEYMKKGRSRIRHELSIPLPTIAIQQLGDAPTGLVWPSGRTGGPLTWLDETLHRIADAAKVRRFSLHDLRTTGNTWLNTYGVGHLVRKRLMGHSLNTGDVTDLYTHLGDDELRSAVSTFDDIFSRLIPSDAATADVVSIDAHRAPRSRRSNR
jgi:integrase